jgi:predicted RNA-binding Zn-ribbon protein involved in translation (DUF1610 family)
LRTVRVAALLLVALAPVARADDADFFAARSTTPLHEAVKANNLGEVQRLLAAGADPNAKNIENDPPLAFAHSHAVVKALVARGAHPSTWVRLSLILYWVAAPVAWGFVPLLLVCVLLLWRSRRSKPPPERKAADEGDKLPRLKAIECAACRAAVPIDPAGAKCPFCGGPLEVPSDYQETLSLRARTAEELRQAVAAWKSALVWTSPSVTLPMRIAAPILLVAVVIGVAGPGGLAPGAEQARLGWYAIFAGALLGLTLAIYGFYLAAERRALPEVEGEANIGEAEVRDCKLCGAPMRFAAGDLVAQCSYCGGEIYRAELARQARVEAHKHEARAALSIYDAMAECRSRRRGAAAAPLVILACVAFVASFFALGQLLVLIGWDLY